MKQLLERGQAIGRRLEDDVAERIASRIRELRGVSAQVEDRAVTIRGKGLTRRWLTDPALRFVADMAR